MDFSTLLSNLQREGLLSDDEAANQALAHAALIHKRDTEGEAAIKTALLAAGLDESHYAEFSCGWLDQADERVAQAWVRQSGIFRAGDDVSSAITGQALSDLLPQAAFVGVDARGQAVDSNHFKFGRVRAEIQPDLIFTRQLLDHADSVLADVVLQARLNAARSNAEAYLHLIDHLLKNSAEQLHLASEDMRVALVWQALARVDTELAGAEVESVVKNRGLQKAFTNAEVFLKIVGLEPMRQLALAMRDGREIVDGFFDGQGANHLAALRKFLAMKPAGNGSDQMVPEFPMVHLVYDELVPIFDELNINVDTILKLNPDDLANWFIINGVERSMPLIAFAQIMVELATGSRGYDLADYDAFAGQSQGLMQAFGAGGGFGAPASAILIPTVTGGYRTLDSIKTEIRVMIREAQVYQQGTPYSEGQMRALSISGIPYDDVDPTNSPLGKIVLAINKKMQGGNHVVVSNICTTVDHDGTPSYFIVMAGTHAALVELERLIKEGKKGKTVEGYPEDVQEMIRGFKDNPNVKDPFRAQQTNVTVAPHDPIDLAGHFGRLTAFLRDPENGITLHLPRTAVLTHDHAVDIRTMVDVDLADLLPRQNFMEPVHVPNMVRNFLRRGATCIVTFGPGTFARNFIARQQNAVPVIAADSPAGWALLDSRNPLDFARDAAPVERDAFVLPTVPVRTHTFGFDDFAAIPGVSVARESLGEGRVKIVVSLTRGYTAAHRDLFKRVFLTQGTGPIQTLLQAGKMMRGGEEIESTFRNLSRPEGRHFSYEFTTDINSIERLRILERRCEVMVIEVIAGDNNVKVTQYYHGNGKTPFERYLKVTRDTVTGDTVTEDMTGYNERSRVAYAKNWGFELAGVFNETFEVPPDDLLSRVAVEYTIDVTSDDMIRFARVVAQGEPDATYTDKYRDGGLVAHPAFAQNVVAKEALLKPMFVRAFGLDYPSVINLGGDKQTLAPLTPGRYTVRGYATSLDDINLAMTGGGSIAGRRLTGFVEVVRLGQDGQPDQVVERYVPRMLSRMVNDVPLGGVRAVVPPRTDKPFKLNPLEGFTVWENTNKNVVARGVVELPADASTNFYPDLNPIHEQDTAAQAASISAKVMQGEATQAWILGAVVRDITGGNPERYVGSTAPEVDPLFTGFIYPGEILTYEATRLRHGEGLHEYEVIVKNEKGKPRLSFKVYAWEESPMFLFNGQGDEYEGMDADVLKDDGRRESIAAFQAAVAASGYDVDLVDAMKRGSHDTRETQPIYAAYDVANWEYFKRLGLVHRHPAFGGHSLGEWLAIWAAGGISTEKLASGVSERGATMGNYVDKANPQGMIVATISTKGLSKPKAEAFVRLIEDLCSAVNAGYEDTDPATVSTMHVAQYNHYGQLGITGHRSAFARATEIIAADAEKYAGIRIQPVGVETAFHSPIMGPAVLNMQAYYREHGNPFSSLKDPVLSDITGKYLPMEDPAAVAAIMAGQIANPVRFIAGIEGELLRGRRLFIEVGPSKAENGGTIKSFIKRIAEVNGIDPNSIRVLYMNRERGPQDWNYVTYEAVTDGQKPISAEDLQARVAAIKARRNPQPVKAEAPKPEKPAGAVEKPSAPETKKPEGGLPAGQPKGGASQDSQRVEMPAAPTYRAITADDVYAAHGSEFGLKVNADNPAEAGDVDLLKHLTEAADSIDPMGDERYQALAARMARDLYMPLEPNAISLLEAHVKYLEGLAGVEGASLVPSPLWKSDEEIRIQLRDILVKSFGVDAAKFDEKGMAVHFEDDFGIDSQDIGGELPMMAAVFEVNITAGDKVGETRKTMESLVEFFRGRLTDPQALPEAKTGAGQLLTLRLLAERKALEGLKEQKRADEERVARAAQGVPMAVQGDGGSGVSTEQLAAFQSAVDAKVDGALAELKGSLAKALGLGGADLRPAEVDLETGRIGEPGEAKKRARDELLAGVEAEAGKRFVASVQPRFDAADIYKMGRTEWNGGPDRLDQFVVLIRQSQLPTDEQELTGLIHHRANQFDANLLARMENWHRPILVKDFGEESSQVQMFDRLIARTKASLAEATAGRGGLFDGVIRFRSKLHVPVLGEDRTIAEDRGLTTRGLIQFYADDLGMNPKMVAALQNLVDKNNNLFGVDIVLTGAGTIGEPALAMFLQLGARVIYIDRKHRDDELRDGSIVSQFYNRLRDEYGIRGMDDQLVVLPGANLSSFKDTKSMFDAIVAAGYNPRIFLNMAAVSDYAAVTAQGDPFTMMGVYALFTRRMTAMLAQHRVKQGFDTPLVVGDLPTPNHNNLRKSGHYWWIKALIEHGIIQEIIYNEGVRLKNGKPSTVSVSVLTPWSNPEDGIDLAEAMASGDPRLMEMMAFYSQALEQVAWEEYKVRIHTTIGQEPAAMIVAAVVEAVNQGSEAPLHQHYDGTDTGFGKLMEVARDRGEDLDDVIGKVKTRVDALNEGAKAARTKPAPSPAPRLPLDGHPIDFNRVARDMIIDPRGAEGLFGARTPWVVHPSTGSTFGAGGVGPYGKSLTANIMGIADLTRPAPAFISPDIEWLYHRDNWDLAHALKIKVEGLSRDEIARKYGKKIDAEVGFRRPAEAGAFEVFMKMPAPMTVEMPIPANQAANFARNGFKIFRSQDGKKVFARIEEGQPIYIPIKKEWPVSVWADIPGSQNGFNWEGVGITHNKDTNELAPGGYVARMGVAQVLNAMGASAKDLVGLYGSEAIFASIALALADIGPFNTLTVEPKFGRSARQSSMNKLLADGAVGQILMEQLGAMGAPLALVEACATGLMNVINAVKHIYARMWQAERLEQLSPEEVMQQLGFAGGFEYANFFSTVLGFVAVGALHTDQFAAEHHIHDKLRSRGTDELAAGFVPGFAGGVVGVAPYDFLLREGFAPWSAIIGFGEKTDGGRAKAREAFGDGVEPAIREALRNAKRVLPADPTEFVVVVDAHLTSTGGDPTEMAAVAKAISESLGLPEGYPIYVQALKATVGHGLGGAGGFAAAVDQKVIHYRIVLGNPAVDNIKKDIGQDSHITISNETTDLSLIYGKNKPIVLVCEAFGFNGKDGVMVIIVPPQVFTDRDAAIVSLTKQLRHYAQARTDEAAVYQLKRPMVQYFADSSNFPIHEYPDLWALYTRSKAIATKLVDEVRLGKLTLSFKDPLSWALDLPIDEDYLPSSKALENEVIARDYARQRIVEMNGRIDATGDVAGIAALAEKQHRPIQPYFYVGGSDGMGIRTFMDDVKAGAVKYAVVVHYDRPGSDRFWNAQEIQKWAAGHGVTAIVLNESALVFDNDSLVVDESWTEFPDEIDWSKLVAKEFPVPVKEAMDRIEALAKQAAVDAGLDTERKLQSGHWIAKNYVAMGRPERVPGAGDKEVASIDPKGRLFMAKVRAQKSWRDAVDRTIGNMGFAHWALVERLRIDGRLGKYSYITQADWKNGEDARALPGVYYGTKESGVAALGLAKKWAKRGIERFRTLFQNEAFANAPLEAQLAEVRKTLGEGSVAGVKEILSSEEFKTANLDGKFEMIRGFILDQVGQLVVAAYPFFFSAASLMIPGAWLFGLQSKKVLDERSHFRTMEKLSTMANLGILKVLDDLKPRQLAEMMIEVDEHERNALDVVKEMNEEISRRIEKFASEHPERLEKAEDGSSVQYISVEDSAELLAGLITPEYLGILAEYMAPDDKIKLVAEKGWDALRGKKADAQVEPEDPDDGPKGGGDGKGGGAFERSGPRPVAIPAAEVAQFERDMASGGAVQGGDGRYHDAMSPGYVSSTGTGDAKASARLTVVGRQPTDGGHGVGSNIAGIDSTGGVVAGGVTYVTKGGAVRVVHQDPLIADPELVVNPQPLLHLVRDDEADDVVGAEAANTDVEAADDASSLTSEAFTIGTGQGIGMGHAIVGGTNSIARSAAVRLFVR